MHRREFLSTAAAVGAGLAVSAKSYAQIVGANDRVRLALIGCGGRGKGVAQRMAAPENNVQYVAFCDVYDTNAGGASSSNWADSEAKTYRDYREVLDRDDIHAVHVATPDHWHAIPSYMACLAGKDVYVEKPMTHNIAEGRALVDVARETNRIVQCGTQHRSAPHYAEIAQMVKEDMLGDIRFARVWNYRNNLRPRLFNAGLSRPGAQGTGGQPADLDWEMYLGPAPLVDFERSRFLGSFRKYYEYAGGFVADYGTHRFDSLRQMLGEPDPLGATAFGGRYHEGEGNTPDVVSATVRFPNFTMSYEAICTSALGVGPRIDGARYYNANGRDDRPHGVALYGSKAVVIADRIGYDVFPETNYRPPRRPDLRRQFEEEGVGEIPEFVAGTPERKHVDGADRTDLHTANFIACIRSRELPNADVDIGHRSTLIPHLINIAYRSGNQVDWDPETEKVTNGNEVAASMVTRIARKPYDIIPVTKAPV